MTHPFVYPTFFKKSTFTVLRNAYTMPTKVETPIMNNLSTKVPDLTQTNYRISYLDQQLCYEHNNQDHMNHITFRIVFKLTNLIIYFLVTSPL